jgi:hypothetical protein
MVVRAVPARDWLAPLAVLIPIGATPPLAFWALSTDPITTGPVFALLVLAAGLAAILAAGRRTYGAAYSLGTAVVTWVVVLVASPFWYAASIYASLCGDMAAGWEWLPPTGAAFAFFALGSFGLRTGRGVMLVPLAGVVALIVGFLLLAVVPGAHGYCET